MGGQWVESGRPSGAALLLAWGPAVPPGKEASGRRPRHGRPRASSGPAPGTRRRSCTRPVAGGGSRCTRWGRVGAEPPRAWPCPAGLRVRLGGAAGARPPPPVRPLQEHARLAAAGPEERVRGALRGECRALGAQAAGGEDGGRARLATVLPGGRGARLLRTGAGAGTPGGSPEAQGPPWRLQPAAPGLRVPASCDLPSSSSVDAALSGPPGPPGKATARAAAASLVGTRGDTGAPTRHSSISRWES